MFLTWKVHNTISIKEVGKELIAEGSSQPQQPPGLCLGHLDETDSKAELSVVFSYCPSTETQGARESHLPETMLTMR